MLDASKKFNPCSEKSGNEKPGKKMMYESKA